VQEHAVFALSQLPDKEGVPILIRVAQTHDSPSVRKKAMFWLGQSDDPRVLALFEEILLRKP
jgi:HEAT repeat protein